MSWVDVATDMPRGKQPSPKGSQRLKAAVRSFQTCGLAALGLVLSWARPCVHVPPGLLQLSSAGLLPFLPDAAPLTSMAQAVGPARSCRLFSSLGSHGQRPCHARVWVLGTARWHAGGACARRGRGRLKVRLPRKRRRWREGNNSAPTRPRIARNWVTLPRAPVTASSLWR